MAALGVDVYSAIEIADNAGRTPLFEAVEADLLEIVVQLTKSKLENGFSVNPNVINYNGQTPLFIAANQGSFEMVNILINAGAIADFNNGELVKPEDDFDEGDSPQEI
jgi:ankyrin repeat protein